jgi:hypothetical protein
MVSKQSDRPYRAGRSCDWVKVQNRRHHAIDRVNRLLQARFDDGDGIDVGHGSSEVDAIATKRGRDHVVAHHGHALDVRDAARRQPGVLPDKHGTKPPMALIEARPGAMSAGPRSAWSHRRRRGCCRSCPWRWCGPRAARSLIAQCPQSAPRRAPTASAMTPGGGVASSTGRLCGESRIFYADQGTVAKRDTRPGWTGRVRCYLRCAGSLGVNLADRRHRYGTVGGWCARAGRHQESTGESHRQLGPIGQ